MSKSPFAGAPRVAIRLLTGIDDQQVLDSRHDARVRARARRERRTPSGEVDEAGNVQVGDLETGDCLLEMPDEGDRIFVEVLPCSEPHRGGAYFRPLSSSAFNQDPGASCLVFVDEEMTGTLEGSRR